MRHVWIILLAVLLPPAGATQGTAQNTTQEPIDFATLLGRMTDLESLATRLPAGTRHLQFSSHDRSSRGDDGNPTRKKAIPTDPMGVAPWFANEDRAHFLRVDTVDGRREAVLAETDGPGYLARIWTANPAGILRIYVDYEKTPLLEGPMATLLGGGISLFPPPLTGERGRGFTFYVPIPFARHVRVTCENPGRLYYHVNIIRYGESTRVRSLKRAALAGHGLDLFRAARDLMAKARPPHQPLQIPFRVAPGHKWTMGWRPWRERPVLRDLLFTSVRAKDLARTLRQTLIIMEFDGVETVRAPLSEFFGCGPRAGDWHGLGVGAKRTHDGMTLYCRFVFPLEREATLYLLNRSESELSGLVSWADDDSTRADRSLRLHASFREAPRMATRPPRDLTLLDVQGAGHVVGSILTVVNPVAEWWGEGDEKIYVDGEAFPSIFGTGTEDYFGYAWCDPSCFSHAYHAQSACDGPGNYGVATAGRVHVLDPIPFDRSIRFDLEVLHWRNCAIDYASTVFYYAPATARDAGRLAPETTPHWVSPTPPYGKEERGIEAERLAAEATAGRVEIQSDVAPWSEARQLGWVRPTPGAVLTIRFDAPRAGRHRVFAKFTVAPDYGRHKLTINGSPEAFEADFYAPEVSVSPMIEIGTFDLRKNDNRITVKYVGRSPRALPAGTFGLDCLRLDPVNRTK